MKCRCYDPNDPGYSRYGAAGIEVCERWKYSFDNFLADMGERPPGKTLDRKDNAKGYSPDNCRWATPKQQIRNRRSTILTAEQALEIRARRAAGERGVDLSREFGVSQQVICDIHKGRYWHAEE